MNDFIFDDDDDDDERWKPGFSALGSHFHFDVTRSSKGPIRASQSSEQARARFPPFTPESLNGWPGLRRPALTSISQPSQRLLILCVPLNQRCAWIFSLNEECSSFPPWCTGTGLEVDRPVALPSGLESDGPSKRPTTAIFLQIYFFLPAETNGKKMPGDEQKT